VAGGGSGIQLNTRLCAWACAIGDREALVPKAGRKWGVVADDLENWMTSGWGLNLETEQELAPDAGAAGQSRYDQLILRFCRYCGRPLV
jgi:hypothetical protein